MQWRVAQIAETLGVPVPSGLDPVARLAGVSIDSRSLQAGQLFIAIRGPRHDGHSFIRAALEGGASAGVVARESFAEYPDEIRGRLFAVDDTLAALQELASRARAIWRQTHPGRKIAAVAGSVGKTTTKEILAALLGARFHVLKTQGNLNNEYGLPLTLLKLDDEYDAVVVELGMSHRGELARLTEIASPDVGVVTRVAIEHLEFFSSIDEIALAERELIESLPWPNATAVLNADDKRVAAFANVARGPAIYFGANPPAQFRVDKIEDRGLAGSAFDLVAPSGRARLELPLIGRHNVMNALAALAAASLWGITSADAKKVFSDLVPADKRGEVVHFDEDFSVINDSYNSSPAALAELMQLLAATPGYRRRILVAGEMLELGFSSPELHRESGRQAAALGKIDWIFGVQGQGAELVRAAIEAGHAPERAQFFENSLEAAKFVTEFVSPGDLILLKGSRGVKMERILDAMNARHRRSTKKGVTETSEAGSRGRR